MNESTAPPTPTLMPTPATGPHVAVRLRSVSKTYRLYQKPVYKLLDLFGLCPPGAGRYTEHQALADINVEVRRGEKVAIIGRNGAGKSTMLKVITGLVQPTAGAVEVNGRISNLLQIGSGFHPDFTGRQNVFASLAHQGIVGREAASLFDEIVDFSEIEEYIDQPMKTYSTGMCSRLMFSASIILKPELLIVDEILGVGDAYFSHKSFERMRDLCSHEGTTLMLVTHDIYGAQNLCDRFIWIDRGRVRHDGDANTAVAMYETSVKSQEEEARRRQSVKAVSAAAPPAAVTFSVIVRSRTGFALGGPLALGQIDLIDMTGRTERLDVGDPSPRGWHLLPEGNLGPMEMTRGRPSRVLRDFGSIYHKAEWIVTAPTPDFRLAAARVQWQYDGTDEAEFLVLDGDRNLLIRGMLDGGAAWQEETLDSHPGSALGEPVQTHYGNAIVRILGTELLDADGVDALSVKHGDPLTIRLLLETRVPPPDGAVTLVLAFTRHGTSFAVNVVEHHLHLPLSAKSVVDVTLPAVRLGSGKWFLRVGVGQADMFKTGGLGYFATDEHWYHLTRDGLGFDVTSVDQLDSSGCFMVHDGYFTVREADGFPRPCAVSTEPEVRSQ